MKVKMEMEQCGVRSAIKTIMPPKIAMHISNVLSVMANITLTSIVGEEKPSWEREAPKEIM